MTKTAPLKLFMAILITFILILPEYFKTPEGNMLKLSCLEMCLQPNLTYLLSSLNFSFMTLLQPIRETQILMGIFLNHTNFQNFTMVCDGFTNEFQKRSSCLVCESRGNMDFTSLEQTSKVLIMRRSVELKANDFLSPCQHFNITVTPILDLEEYTATCTLKTQARKSAITEEDLTEEQFTNHTCRITEDLNKCIHTFLHLEMDVKNFTCSMKITWYILVLSVFILLIILIIYKILEDHRRVRKWQRHKYKPTSVLLRGSDSEKLIALNVRVIPETTKRRPLTQVEEVLPPIPELEIISSAHQQEQCTRTYTLDN
ncbi:transmembrane protein 156 isoform X2 [Choloepus didactylus]|uniref:transmembrane protein 156 isoform X2 n=1 Tax=Choloepus didactylus TaxID=27675 RepID=UPI00189FEEDF|nr:transmembrane protein 156 isoform X2 [Choloepus didactylus]